MVFIDINFYDVDFVELFKIISQLRLTVTTIFLVNNLKKIHLCDATRLRIAFIMCSPGDEFTLT